MFRRSLSFGLLFGLIGVLYGLASAVQAQPFPNPKYGQEDKFRQLEEILPTPNSYRSAAGEPGPDYWQQKIDYNIDVTLDDEKQEIHGFETIRYHNQSPHTLRYLWVQLDANIFAPDSIANKTKGAALTSLQVASLPLNWKRSDLKRSLTAVARSNRSPTPKGQL